MGVPDYASVDRIDETSFVVRMVPPSGLPEESDTRFFSSWSGLTASIEDASATVASIAWNPLDKVYEPHVLEQRLSRVEWGASGTGLQFVLDVSSNVTADAILVGIGYVVAKLRHSKFAASPDVSDLLELEAYARQAVYRSFELAVDEELELRSSETVGRTGHFLYEDSDHDCFEAVVGLLDSGEPYVKVTRRPAAG